MCGIVGVAGPLSRAEAGELAERMNAALVHRGPDDAGLWATDGFAFAMRRLSIIDLGGGHQPIWSDDGVGIVFNGEIYNYRALRHELEAEGCRFRTQSDTEVVLHLFRRDGLAMVERLEGMFAICLYDPRDRQVHLVRDRFGVKPLYYGLIDGALYFASEIKAILQALPKRPDLNRQALHDYLTLRFVPGAETVWKGISKLPPAHTLTFGLDGRAGEPQRYWALDFAAEAVDPSRDYRREFAELFLAATEKRLVAADVPVGVLLSGGLDSSAVSAAAVELGHRNFHTFSVAFADSDAVDETPYARQVAAHIGSEHHEIRIGRDEFVSFLPDFVRAIDEPLADLASVPLQFVSRLARQDVKVVLSGEGSDEILAGYNFDRLARMLVRLQRAERLVPAALRRAAAPLPVPGDAGNWLRLWSKHGWQGLLAARRYHMTAHWSEAEKAGLWRECGGFSSTDDRLAAAYRVNALKHPIDQVQQIYCGDWLTEDLLMKADKMSMATSLEVREPFLDHRLAEWAAKLPLQWRVGDATVGYESKRILRDFCRSRLPRAIIERPKQGFPVPAYAWLAGPLKDWAGDILFGHGSRLHDLFDMDRVRPALAAAQRGNGPAAHKVWLLIVLEHWLRTWL
jgi:asparagine synthase (glutamine-hydrolysing)